LEREPASRWGDKATRKMLTLGSAMTSIIPPRGGYRLHRQNGPSAATSDDAWNIATWRVAHRGVARGTSLHSVVAYGTSIRRVVAYGTSLRSVGGVVAYGRGLEWKTEWR